MESDRELMHDLAIQHLEEEGAWMLVCAPAGDDND